MTLTGDGAPRPEQRPAVGDMKSSELRRHLREADHGSTAPLASYTWVELVAEHNRSHRVWDKIGHEHDQPPRPEE